VSLALVLGSDTAATDLAFSVALMACIIGVSCALVVARS
jgi:hypothetical protein